MKKLKLDNSINLFEEAKRLHPGGVLGIRRPDNFVEGEYPIFLTKGQGCKVTDMDDNEYIDMLCSYGPIIIGHREKKIDDAQFEFSKLGSQFLENPEYLYLRSKIFFLNKLYYIAIDTLLIALEFEQNDKFYNMLAKIYEEINNKELSKKLLDPNLRLKATNSLKNELSGIFRKNVD